MASLLDKKVVKDDRKFLIGMISALIFMIWMFFPSGNRIIQIGYWINNIAYFVSSHVDNGAVVEYKHYKDNAVYLAKINPRHPQKALDEIDKAIAKIPDYASQEEISSLYATRANIKLYYGDKKGAMNDYLLAKKLNINDDLRLAILLADNKQYKLASEYCKDILFENSEAFSGYACLAYVYESAGRKDTAVTVYNIAIDKKPNNALAYIERANLKKRLNDAKGYEEDVAKAKNLLPKIDTNKSIFHDAVSSKKDLLALT